MFPFFFPASVGFIKLCIAYSCFLFFFFQLGFICIAYSFFLHPLPLFIMVMLRVWSIPRCFLYVLLAMLHHQ